MDKGIPLYFQNLEVLGREVFCFVQSVVFEVDFMFRESIIEVTFVCSSNVLTALDVLIDFHLVFQKV